jgi:hypothetical protein
MPPEHEVTGSNPVGRTFPFPDPPTNKSPRGTFFHFERICLKSLGKDDALGTDGFGQGIACLITIDGPYGVDLLGRFEPAV